jgi:hypothetical protein
MSAPGSITSNSEQRWTPASVTLHFSVAYPTQWGQSILLAGSGALLGSLKWESAKQLSCHHEKDVLLWEATIALPWKPSYTYKYALVSPCSAHVCRPRRPEPAARCPGGLRCEATPDACDLTRDLETTLPP